jgi:hypothetical protein
MRQTERVTQLMAKSTHPTANTGGIRRLAGARREVRFPGESTQIVCGQ